MKLYLFVYCLDDLQPDGTVISAAHPTDYEPFAALVCGVNFTDARSAVNCWSHDTLIYEVGDAVMGTPAGLVFETTEGVMELKARLRNHPRHKVRRA